MRCVAVTVFAALVAAAEAGSVPASLYDQADPVNLPELMRTSNGALVKTKEMWENVRRPEILKFATENIYGVRPVDRPSDLKFEQICPDRRFPESGMVRKLVRASFSGPRGKWSFDITSFLPDKASAASPVPVFLLICNRPMSENVDLERRKKTGFFPAEAIVTRGYAAVVFKNTDLALDAYHPSFAKDGTAVIQDPPFTNGLYACWEPARTEHSWGAISAWAWGASRVMDWIETEPSMDAGHVAVVGHSRGGKTSLWTAASDTRFAMACVNDSGCCGAKLNHVAVPCSETIQQDNNNNPHWFCRAYRRFNGLDAHLPFDQHWIAALVAPRLLYISSASRDYPAGPWGEFLTARHASPVWDLYGMKGLVENHPYRIGDPFHEGNIAYHLRKGGHNLTLEDWNNFMDFADRHGWRAAVR